MLADEIRRGGLAVVARCERVPQPENSAGSRVDVERAGARGAGGHDLVHRRLSRQVIRGRCVTGVIDEDVIGTRARIVEAGPEELPVVHQRDFPSGIAGTEHRVAAACCVADTDQRVDATFLAVTDVREAGLVVDVDALEVATQPEVDDAGHRVRTVGRRRAAADDLDAGHGRRRERVDVDRHRRIDGLGAAAVEQHQAAARAEAAHVQRRGAGGVLRRRLNVGGRELRGAGAELRILVQDGLEPDGAVLLESLGVDGEDRARRIQVAANDARARDDDFLDLVRLLGMRNATETQARADARGERRPLQLSEQCCRNSCWKNS